MSERTACTFFLGIHQPHWTARTDVPLFLSAARLRDRRTTPPARGPWALDSGGFSELTLYGRWETPAMQYASEAAHWQQTIGNMQWAAVQDWMCEPHLLAKTGFAIAEHQRRTTHSYLLLRRLAPGVNWLPVIQGWRYDDYADHVRQYEAAGIDLRTLPVVGIGSVCRRQDTYEAEEVIRDLHTHGIALHGFGFKIDGLRRSARHLKSADSMAWSLAARYGEPLPGCTHKNCANCLRYALKWRLKVLRAIEQAEMSEQTTLFAENPA